MLGTFYLQQNNLTKAEEYLTKTISVEPKNTSAKVLLLGIYETQNNATKVKFNLQPIKISCTKRS